MDMLNRIEDEKASFTGFTAEENREWLVAKRQRQAEYLERYGRPVLNDVLLADEPRFDFDFAPRVAWKLRPPVDLDD